MQGAAGANSRLPPSPFPTTPQTGLGAPQVPSADNAAPTSPLNTQNQPLGGGSAQSPTPSSGASSVPLGPSPLAPGNSSSTSPSNGTSTGTTGMDGSSRIDPTTGKPVATDPLTGDPTNPAARQPQIQDIPGGGGKPPAGSLQTGSAIPGPDASRSQGGASGATFDQCAAEWDASSHMTQQEWRSSCARLGR
jgi:hypothetical protein